MSESSIEVVLTQGAESPELHCFQIIFRPKGQPVPIEIYLHTTQAIELCCQLSRAICRKHQEDSAELLRIKTAALEGK